MGFLERGEVLDDSFYIMGRRNLVQMQLFKEALNNPGLQSQQAEACKLDKAGTSTGSTLPVAHPGPIPHGEQDPDPII